MDSKHSGVAAAAVKGIRWNYLGNLFSIICSLTVTSVLARILGPGPFGEALIASTIYGFVNLFVNGGLSQALIQQEHSDPLQVRRVFTTQIVLSITLTLMIVLLAPTIARLFHSDSATSVIRVMALIITIQAFGLVPAALLRREMRFNVIQHANISAYVVGYIFVGLPLAFHGAGVWSLAAAYMSQALITSSYLYASVRHPVVPSFQLPDQRSLMFGSAVVGSNVVNWGHSNLDNLASSCLGPASLGLYGRTCNLAYQPVTAVVTILQPVLFSAAAKVRSKPEVLRRALLSIIALTSGVVLPAYIALAFVPYTVIIGLYGYKWMPAVPLMVPMALAMPMWGVMALCGPVLAGIGKPQKEFWAQGLTCAAAGVAFYAASRFSLLAIAWVLLGVTAARLIAILAVTFHALDIAVTDATEIVAGRLLVAVPFGLVMFTSDRLMRSSGVGISMCLMLLATEAFLLLGVVIWMFPRIAFGNYAIQFLHDNRLYLPSLYRSRILPQRTAQKCSRQQIS